MNVAENCANYKSQKFKKVFLKSNKNFPEKLDFQQLW